MHEHITFIKQYNMELKNHHLKRISHAIGVNLYHAILSDKKIDRTLPKDFYRNYYQVDSDYSLDELVDAGLAIQSKHMGLNYYYITEEGVNKFREVFESLIQYTTPKSRDLEYVKSKINLYCWYNDYTLTADYIIKEYENFKNGFYVSHTAKDVLNQFKSEIKKAIK